MSMNALAVSVGDTYRLIQRVSADLSRFATRVITKIDAGSHEAKGVIDDVLPQLLNFQMQLEDSSPWPVNFKNNLTTYAAAEFNSSVAYLTDYEILRTEVADAIAAASAALDRDLAIDYVLYLKIDEITGVATVDDIVTVVALRAALVDVVTAAG